MRAYLDFIARSPRLAAFGFLTALGSSFGQTFLIGIFGPPVRAEFGLGHGGWSAIYLAGTLGSALLLPWTGKAIDRLATATYGALVWSASVLACLAFSATIGPLTLVLGIFALRHCGQGLMSHLALTAMARAFDRQRGRAIAVATLGFAAGNAVLPILAVAAIEAVGWRWTYREMALGLVVGLAAAQWLLGTSRGRPPGDPVAPPPAPGAGTTPRGWTRAEVLRDARFYLLLPGIVAPSLVSTAMFFHHLAIAEAKGWSPQWMAGSYPVFALASVLASLVSGQLVDRYRAVRVVPLALLPQGLALVVLALLGAPWSLWLYLALLGLCTGTAHTAMTAMWAELYGVAHIGAVRSLAAAINVFGSALGPIVLGVMLDAGLATGAVCVALGAYSFAGAGLIALALARPPRRCGHSN